MRLEAFSIVCMLCLGHSEAHVLRLRRFCPWTSRAFASNLGSTVSEAQWPCSACSSCWSCPCRLWSPRLWHREREPCRGLKRRQRVCGSLPCQVRGPLRRPLQPDRGTLKHICICKHTLCYYIYMYICMLCRQFTQVNVTNNGASIV